MDSAPPPRPLPSSACPLTSLEHPPGPSNLYQSHSMPPSGGGAPPPAASFRPPPPFTAATAHRDHIMPPGLATPLASQGSRSRDPSLRSCDLKDPSLDPPQVSSCDSNQPGMVSLSEQLPRSYQHLTTVGGARGEEFDGDNSNARPKLVDPEMERLEGKMDTWCLDLKRNVMVSRDVQRIPFKKLCPDVSQ